MIRVENKKTYTGDGIYIGRPTPLGNPFTHLASSTHGFVKVETRDEAIARYRPWLEEKLKTENPTSKAFKVLVDEYKRTGELVLICWCKPLSCHGDILAEMIEEYIANESSS